MNKKISIVFVLFFLFTITVVSAHKPIFENKDTTITSPIIIDDHTISYAVYGSLDDKNDVDFLEFDAKEGEKFYIEMLVPKIKSNIGFEPNFAIISKEISTKHEVPFTVPKGYGVINVVYPKNYENEFYEKFTQTKYLKGQSISGIINKSGKYIIAVYSAGKGGKYTLAIGKKEDFGIKDLITFPYVYFKIKYFFNPVFTCLGLAAIFIFIVGLINIKRKRR
ncbi:hypothetical protein [Thermobrachium celere]|uniref:Uncharacterized protein n=1 Tax=Thermobrachium celere DSM 8682 TaxID=941824 RepID=R7RST7_9CLOT|nr:hypothetical protein [Thermobrachium celere]CDF58353.1 hypothetical protein TCEL_00399 [Thermobrachium celere DSM 8682]